jgi:hypothetical protein
LRSRSSIGRLGSLRGTVICERIGFFIGRSRRDEFRGWLATWIAENPFLALLELLVTLLVLFDLLQAGVQFRRIPLLFQLQANSPLDSLQGTSDVDLDRVPFGFEFGPFGKIRFRFFGESELVIRQTAEVVAARILGPLLDGFAQQILGLGIVPGKVRVDTLSVQLKQ